MGLTRPTAAQINTVITTINDPITVLNKGSTLANIDVGFIINRNGGALANTAIFWNESANTFVTAFTAASGATDANISISTYANLRVGTLTATFVNTTGNIIAGGNVTATYFTGSGQFLTGLPASYSNVNVKAYTESMGYQNYGNVNVAAYITTNGLTNYSNINLAAYLGGAVTVGGNLTVQGNLIIQGTTTTVNSTTLDVADLNITVAKGAASAAAANGAGLTVDGAGATLLYTSSTDSWNTNKAFISNSFVNTTGNISGDIVNTGALNATGTTTLVAVNSTGFINTTGNVSAAVHTGGAVSVTGFINTSGNVSAAQINSATAVVTGSAYVGELFATTRAGDEGGQLNLANAVTNTTLIGNIVIDVYQNRLRIYEGGGTNRGGYFDLSGLSATVGTNLAGGGGGTPGGGNGQLQFNSSSAFAGAASLYYFAANGAIVANAGIASTSTTTGTMQITGGIGVTGNVTADQIYAVNNGNGRNIRIGDDAWLGDVNVADTTQLSGAQNSNNGYLRFGNVGTETLGRAGAGTLIWTGGFGVSGPIYANASTVSTSTSTGALIVAGGIGAAGALYVGNIVLPGYSSNIQIGTQVTPHSNAPFDVSIAANSFVQINVQNIDSVGTLNSADFIATAPNGTDTTNFIDMGINGNNFVSSGWTISRANDGYVYIDGGNLTLGTATAGRSVRIHTGGLLDTNIVAEYYAANLTMIGNINPTVSNVYSLGTTTSRWSRVWGVSVNAQYADLAENYTADQDYAPGTVLVFGGSAEVTQSTASHDPRIAGIVSTNPAYLMNGAEPGIPVALQGRVPCLVLGPVAKGDRLVASQHPGIAQRLDKELYEPGCIIGKALQDIETTTISTIEVVVGRL